MTSSTTRYISMVLRLQLYWHPPLVLSESFSQSQESTLCQAKTKFVAAIISIEKCRWVAFWDFCLTPASAPAFRYRKHYVQWRTKWCQHCPKCLWWSSRYFLGDWLQKRMPSTTDEESDGWLEPKTTWCTELCAIYFVSLTCWICLFRQNILKTWTMQSYKMEKWLELATSQGQIPS